MHKNKKWRIMLKVVVAAVAVLLMVCGTAVGATNLNEVRGNGDNNITPKANRMLPDCGNPKPCTGDLKGTKQADLIYGLGGWDWVHSGAGDDVIYGGGSMDQLYANEGDDRLIGGRGHDHLFGDSGDDYLNAADGADEPMHVEATFGDRELLGQSGNDTCVLDEDPQDGVVIGGCEKVVIRSVPGLDGGTPWGKMQGCVLDDTCIEGYLTPDTYTRLR